MAIEAFLNKPVIVDGKETNVVQAYSFGKSNGFIYFKNKDTKKFLWVKPERIEQISGTAVDSYEKQMEEK